MLPKAIQKVPTVYQKRYHSYPLGIQNRLLTLMEHFKDTILAQEENLGVLYLCCQYNWLRPLREFSFPKKGNPKTALIQHLICRYQVPKFLFRQVLKDPVLTTSRRYRIANRKLINYDIQKGFKEADTTRIFLHLASGGSFKEILHSGLLNVPLTKRGWKYFLKTPEGMELYPALRLAQIRSLNGSELLANSILSSILSLDKKYAPEEESFIEKMLLWFSQQKALESEQVDPLIDYFFYQRRVDTNYKFSGRSLKKTLKKMKVWLERIRLKNEPYNTSGYLPFSGKEEWSISEILTPLELHIEGTQLKHCVFSSYQGKIKDQISSIWSLQREGQRLLTIEVNLAEKAVVQAKGSVNRKMTPLELDLIHQWAEKNHLEVRLKLTNGS